MEDIYFFVLWVKFQRSKYILHLSSEQLVCLWLMKSTQRTVYICFCVIWESLFKYPCNRCPHTFLLLLTMVTAPTVMCCRGYKIVEVRNQITFATGNTLNYYHEHWWFVKLVKVQSDTDLHHLSSNNLLSMRELLCLTDEFPSLQLDSALPWQGETSIKVSSKTFTLLHTDIWVCAFTEVCVLQIENITSNIMNSTSGHRL